MTNAQYMLDVLTTALQQGIYVDLVLMPDTEAQLLAVLALAPPEQATARATAYGHVNKVSTEAYVSVYNTRLHSADEVAQ